MPIGRTAGDTQLYWVSRIAMAKRPRQCAAAAAPTSYFAKAISSAAVGPSRAAHAASSRVGKSNAPHERRGASIRPGRDSGRRQGRRAAVGHDANRAGAAASRNGAAVPSLTSLAGLKGHLCVGVQIDKSKSRGSLRCTATRAPGGPHQKSAAVAENCCRSRV